ncbi:YdeI/OmpD-associated family protein [Pedobacter sp. SYSU D00535]|uniref:YdeI/OmpD-associated family protein n=1 Tax=Pedobacter sp. SYSU D00535 TaxID=2810308 RepID=UPI001A977330|nr:YdeI/OmpD-associated family protein [Pedobacter sp. SYSU D00535]
MVDFSTIIQKFAEHGDKTGWSYIEVPADVAESLNPGVKKTYRVKGKLDSFEFSGLALLPTGGGGFILPLNARIRRGIKKEEGAILQVRMEVDTDFEIKVPDELTECLEEDAEALAYFNSLRKSHRDYFIKWIDSAKTYETRVRRIVNTVNAMVQKQDYGQMIRSLRGSRT